MTGKELMDALAAMPADILAQPIECSIEIGGAMETGEVDGIIGCSSRGVTLRVALSDDDDDGEC